MQKSAIMSQVLFMNEAYYQREQKRSPRIIFTLIIVLLLSGFLVYAGSNILGIKETKVQEAKITPGPTEFVFPTESNSADAESNSADADASSSPTPEATSIPPTINPVDKTTGLNRSKLSVAVQNGSGETGAASKVSEVLKEFGYEVVSIGNADSFTYENMVIDIKQDKSSYLPLLKKDLEITYTIGSTSATLSSSSSADAASAAFDAVVIVGK